MSSPMTRGQLKTRALELGDFLNSPYIDTSIGGELERYVDTELRNLWNLCIETDDDFCARGPYYLSTTANQNVYILPPDFYKLKAIYYSPNSPGQPPGRKFPLKEFTFMEYGSHANYYNWGPPPIFYRLVGPQEVLFDPPPSTAQSNIIEYWYIPQYHTPSSDSQVLTQFVAPGWEDYVVYGVVMKLRFKEESPTIQLAQQFRDQFEMKLRSLAANRDRFRPQKIEDSGWDESGSDYGQNNFWGYYGSW